MFDDRFKRRFGRRDLRSTAVQPETLGDLIKVTSLASASTTLNNGEYDTFDITITQNDEQPIIVPECYIAIYEGSVASANLIFDGSTASPGSADPTDYNVVGPFYNYDEWNKQLWQSKISFSIENVSAGASTTLYVYTLSKYITRAKGQ